MMTSSIFQQLLDKDLDDVFFNFSEFGEVHNVDGDQVPCQLQKMETKDRISSRNVRDDGVFLDSSFLYIAGKYLEKFPVENQKIFIDQVMYIVQSVDEQRGLLVIELLKYSI